jgi:AcrR family transcriptional regulator
MEEGVESMPSMPEDQPKKSHNATIKNYNQDRQMEEDIEISEELEAFIDQCLEEGLSEEEIAEAIDENFEILEEDYDDLEEDIDYEYTVDMSEHVAALFEGEDLSEEFKQKAIAIFEAAVTSTVKSELAAIEEAYAATLEEEVDGLKEELSSNVDDYLNYVVENWVSENEVAIEAGLRTELTEEFISGLRNLFAENYIDIPEEQISVVEELGDKVAELENKLNEEIERNVELNAILSESKKTEVMYAMTEGLTTTQAEKLKSLAENVEFTSEQEYAHKVATLRESYFPSSITSHSQLDYIEPGSDGKSMISESLEGPMARYVEVLGKKLPN